MYGYIYRTHNIVNGKMYIGKRVSKVFLENKYLGSGKILKQAINKYGRDNFTVEILEECFSSNELNEREIYWIEYYNAVNDDNYYNLSEGGHGGFDFINKNRLSPACLSREQHPMFNKLGIDNPRYGKRHSGETKLKLSKLQTGKRSITNGIITKRIDSNDQVPEGFWYGESYSDNRKWSEIRKIKFSSKTSNTVVINNGVHTIRVKESDLNKYLENGYIKGYRNDQIKTGSEAPAYGMRHSDEFKKLVSEKTKGTVWINNGIKCKRVKKYELDNYINEGWFIGRKLVERATTIEK